MPMMIDIENTKALFVASKKTELEVNADKTKYMAMSEQQNAGRSHILYFPDATVYQGSFQSFVIR
jgi:hypothetical protein